MDRHVRGLAGNIPQRDINCADCADRRKPATAPDCVVKPLALKRILPHQRRLQISDSACGIGRARLNDFSKKCVTLDSVVRRNSQQAEVVLLSGLLHDVIRDSRQAFPRKKRKRDIGNFHQGTRLETAGSNTIPQASETGCNGDRYFRPCTRQELDMLANIVCSARSIYARGLSIRLIVNAEAVRHEAVILRRHHQNMDRLKPCCVPEIFRRMRENQVPSLNLPECQAGPVGHWKTADLR